MKKILIQLDTDPQPSVFDRVVAVDAGADEVFSYGNVDSVNVVKLVHGAIFTRGPENLKNTAIFVGGKDVEQGEAVCRKVTASFFGPMHVSVMMDSNGSNTTAAAAVLMAAKHLGLSRSDVLVLGATGPVGQRVCQLLASVGANVCAASRSREKAQRLVEKLQSYSRDSKLSVCETGNEIERKTAIQKSNAVISCGAAGVQLLPEKELFSSETLELAIDLNAVPPVGLEGVDLMDKAKERNGTICYGAIGVGGLKMKIHKRAISKLFSSSQEILQTEEIYQQGKELL